MKLPQPSYLAWPQRGRGQAQQKPDSAKAVKAEAERDRNPVHGSDKKPSVLETGTAKQTRQKAYVAQSQNPETSV